MSSWYIDRSKNLQSILECESLCLLKENVDMLVSMDSVDSSQLISTLKIGGKNPNALLTCFRDLGVIDLENQPTPFLKACVKSNLSNKIIALLILLKKDSEKKDVNTIKPFVVIAKALEMMGKLGIDLDLYWCDCVNHLMNISQYNEITEEFIRNMVSTRISDFNDKVGVLDIWFNALIYTGLFSGSSDHIVLKPNYKKFISLIANHGQIMEPSKNREEYIRHACSSSYGISKIVQAAPVESILALDALDELFSYVRADNSIKDVYDNDEAEADNSDVLLHNLYGIHIKNENAALRDSHICVGWSAIGDMTNINSRKELTDLYYSFWPNSKPKAAGQDVGQLWRFISEAQVGDYVIFAEPTTISIGRITSEYIYNTAEIEGQDSDYVNQRKVEWLLKQYDRSNLSRTFRNSLAAAMSFFSLNDYKSVVKDLLDGNYIKDEDIEEVEIMRNEFIELKYDTKIMPNEKRNRIVFGAPGTGKSNTLEKDRADLLSNGGTYERVTFHPDYTYANFVGTYKPVPTSDGISYEYVPGPFMRVYVEALKDARDNKENAKPHILIVEEINRANVAAVFGDVFQLLDRKDRISEYPIQASEDIKAYLASEKGLNAGLPNNYSEIKIPDNMFIWATMNSADQGVFPMDTAFKRRWDFMYIGIDEKADKTSTHEISLASGQYTWNTIRMAINRKLSALKVNEDKLLGPFFIPLSCMEDDAAFVETFKNKVLMYLFEDAAKQKRNSLFAKTDARFCDICEDFDSKGLDIFLGLEFDE